MKHFKIAIILIIVLFTMAFNERINAITDNNQKYIFYLNNKGNYFSSKSISKVHLMNQKIYPGSSGYFDIIVNTQDYSFNINYNLNFFNLKNKPQNLYFIIGDEKVNSLDELDSIHGFMEKGKEELIKRVYWYWDYEIEDNYVNQSDFTFEMSLLVERENCNHNANKLPRTGLDKDGLIGVVIAILLTYFLIKIKTIISKENNEINKNI